MNMINTPITTNNNPKINSTKYSIYSLLLFLSLVNILFCEDKNTLRYQLIKPIQSYIHRPNDRRVESYDFGYLYGSTSFLPSIGYSYSKFGYSNSTSWQPSLNSALGGEFSSIATSGNGVIGQPNPQKCLSVDLYNSFYKFYCYEPFKEKINFYDYSSEDRDNPWVSLYFNLEYEEDISDELKGKLTFEESQNRKRDQCLCSLKGYRLIASEAELYIYINKNYKYGKIPKNPLPPSIQRIATEYTNENFDSMAKINKLIYSGGYEDKMVDKILENKAQSYIAKETSKDRIEKEEILKNNLKISNKEGKKETKDVTLNKYKKDFNLDEHKDKKESKDFRTNSKYKDTEFNSQKDKGDEINKNNPVEETKSISKIIDGSFRFRDFNHINFKSHISKSRDQPTDYEDYNFLKFLQYDPKFNSKLKSRFLQNKSLDKSLFSKKKKKDNEDESESYKDPALLPKNDRIINDFVDISDSKHTPEYLKTLRNKTYDKPISIENEMDHAIGFRVKLPKKMTMSAEDIYRYIRSWKQIGSFTCDWSKFEVYDYLFQMLNDDKLMNMGVTLVYKKYTVPLDSNVNDLKEKEKIEYWTGIFKWNIYKFRKLMEVNSKCLYILDSSQYLKKLYRSSDKFAVDETDFKDSNSEKDGAKESK